MDILLSVNKCEISKNSKNSKISKISKIKKNRKTTNYKKLYFSLKNKCIQKDPSKFHGRHIFADFIWNPEKDIIKSDDLAHKVFEVMEKSLEQTSMTIVHKKLCILGEDGRSPPGFTSIILIDESHISSHCYSDKGWLALDVFTCSTTNPVPIMKYIIDNLEKEFPTLKCTFMKKNPRFHYI